jgi:hypothetical protein
MLPEIFQNFFSSKHKVFGPVQIPKKVILFGFSTGTKGEFRFFSPLVTKSEKYHFFTFGPGTKKSKSKKKIQKKFFWILVSVQRPYF